MTSHDDRLPSSPHHGFVGTRVLRRSILVWARGLGIALSAIPAWCDPAAGFVEEWSVPGMVNEWSGPHTLTNPGTGGVGGAGDGFLHLASSHDAEQTGSPYHHEGKFGTVTFSSVYAGDWVAAGITEVKFSLNDVDSPQPLEIHFSLGNAENFWQYNEGCQPPAGQWTEYSVDLTSSANWTQISGSGSFEDALRNVDRVHFRHDLAPFSLFPDWMDGDVGIDRLMLLSTTTRVLPLRWETLKRRYR
jgi:hypothetical protein